jgi:hypothetical protein
MDANTQSPLSFDNLFVLYGDYSFYSDQLCVRFDFENGGVGYYFSQGHYQELIWTKPTSYDPFRFFDKATGEELLVNCGNSYVALADIACLDSLDIR